MSLRQACTRPRFWAATTFDKGRCLASTVLRPSAASSTSGTLERDRIGPGLNQQDRLSGGVGLAATGRMGSTCQQGRQSGEVAVSAAATAAW